jgi:hypothetical protein
MLQQNKKSKIKSSKSSSKSTQKKMVKIPKTEFVKTLLPHQTQFIKYTQKECYTKIGFLLFHFMGTGKTITALSWAMNYSKFKTFIICPIGIENTWKLELKKIDKLSPMRKLTIINFDKFFANFANYEKELKDSVLIVDEAHNICNFFHTERDFYLKDSMLNVLKIPHRILLCSGTPLVHSITDLSILINIITKRETLPMDSEQFYQTYGRVNASANNVKWLTNKFNDYYYIYKDMLKKNMFIMVSLFLSNIPILFPTHNTFLSKELLNFKKVFTFEGQSFPLEIRLTVYMMIFFILSQVIAYGSGFLFTKVDDNKRREMLYETGSGFSITNYYDLDYNKISKDITNHVDYYVPLSSNDINEYPSKIYNMRYYELDLKQNMTLLELMTNNLTIESMKSLQLTKYSNFSLVKSIGNNFENYLKIGQMVSNTCEFTNYVFNNDFKIKKHSKTGFRIAKGRNDKQKYQKLLDLLSLDNLSTLSAKYKFIIERIRKKKKKTLIYSSFYKQGYRLFSILLNFLGIHHYILDTEQTLKIREEILNHFNYNTSSTKVILIHPSITEGISLLEVRELHILEPMPVYTSRDQLIARCVRYRSHSRLPADKRNVTIFDHVYRQANLIHGEMANLEYQIASYRGISHNQLQKEINFDRSELKLSKQLKPKAGKEKKTFLHCLATFNSAIDRIIYNYDITRTDKRMTYITEQAELQYNAKNMTGPNKALLQHLRHFINSENGKDKIFDLYNWMYAPTNTRRKFLVNPDENAFLQAEKRGNIISLILNDLRKTSEKTSGKKRDDPSCKQRECKVWVPTDRGTCRDINTKVK